MCRLGGERGCFVLVRSLCVGWLILMFASGRQALTIDVGETEDEQPEDLKMEDDRFEDYSPEAYQPQFSQRQVHRPEHLKLPIFPWPLNRPFPTGPFLNNSLQVASPLPTGLEQRGLPVPLLDSLSLSPSVTDTQSTSSSPTALTPYDPYLRMDILTNEALLSMVQAWQDIMQYAGRCYSAEHPHFQRTMEELCRRGLVGTDWTRSMDLERVNLALTRVVV